MRRSRLLRALERCFPGLSSLRGDVARVHPPGGGRVRPSPPLRRGARRLVLVEAATGAGPGGRGRFEEGARLPSSREGLCTPPSWRVRRPTGAKLWAFRESPFTSTQAKLPKWVGFDVSFTRRPAIGRGRVGAARAAASPLAAGAERDLRPHPPYSNLHLIVGPAGLDKAMVEETVYAIVADFGGFGLGPSTGNRAQQARLARALGARRPSSP